MRELRVTGCGFGKTVEEVERRHFVKLKRCVLEPVARGFLAIARRCRLNKSIRQRFAFALKIQQMACAMIKPAGSHSYLESAVAIFQQAYYLKITSRSVVELQEKPAATRIQQQRNFSSDADFIFSKKNSDCSTRSKILEQKTPPVEIRKDFSRVQGRIHAILSQSSVQATNQQVRDLGRIRAIELLPDFIQTAGFVLPDFTPYS
ncbi:hypothetical protein F511_28024 [Dorcoceras hygrometricum]|uniref:Uncharacterized protein n=1 Tax=Dorcoceras hygrometricum TaxID=472368 RepID=A0A2Z7AIJ3_9LAMI|nr:hypothetical protein F511_28024 [Dorcoceras hygrometricum]